MVPNPLNGRTCLTGGGSSRQSVRAAVVLSAAVLVAVGALGGTVAATTTTIGFEAFDEGTGLTTQYEADGVRFVTQDGEAAGAIVESCTDGDPACQVAWNGQNAVVTPERNEVTPTGFGTPRHPLVAAFTEPQEAVRLYVQDAGDVQGTQIAMLTARNSAGTVVARSRVRFDANTGWHQISVSTDEAAIETATLVLAWEGNSDDPHNIMAVDGLTFVRNEPPTAAFEFAPLDPGVNESVEFDASASDDVDGEIVEYRWDFNGDGRIDATRQQPQVTAVYRAAGTYEVRLVVVDDDGAVETRTRDVTVSTGNEPPAATFDVAPDQPFVDEDVTLDASASTDVDGEIVEYRWDFGADGTIEEVRQPPTVDAVFRNAGTHAVALVVVDDDGATDRFTREITVLGPPVARCSVDDTELQAGEQVVIDASASDAREVRFDVDGDGDFDRTSTTSFRAPVRYDQPGTYRPVVRAVVGDRADTLTCAPITVNPSGLGPDVAVGGTGGLVGLWVLRRAHSRLRDGTDDEPPAAAIVYAPHEPDPGQPVAFAASGSVASDLGDQVAAYEWSVGEQEYTGQRFVHVFPDEGETEVSLRVLGPDGVDTASETVAVESTAGELALERVHPDAPGDDHRNLDAEYLVFGNAGDDTLDLGGWTVHDTAEAEGRVEPGEHTFTFPEGFELDPDETVTVHTGAPPADDGESAEAGHLYWDASRAIWNNAGDEIVVEDAGGHPVLAVEYTRTEAGDYELKDLDVEVLEGWFPTVVLSRRDEAPAVRVSLRDTTPIALASAATGFIVGAAFLRGPKAFLSSWANIAGYLLSSSIAWVVTIGTGLLPPSIERIVPVVLVAGSAVMVVVGGVGVGLQSAVSLLWGWIADR